MTAAGVRIAAPKMLDAEPLPQYARVTKLIRAYVIRERLTVAALARAVGAHSVTTPYRWITGEGGPAPQQRERLAELLGVPATELIPDIELAPGRVKRAPLPIAGKLGPARQAVALVSQVAAAPPPVAGAIGGKLGYESHGDGTATITLRARLPLDQAKPLFRLLLDSGADLDQGTS